MLTAIICGLVSFFWTYYKGEFYKDFGLSALLGALGFIGGIFFSIMLPANMTIQEIKYEIVSMQDNTSNSGKFFLGSGQIKEEPVYSFYYKDNGYRLKVVEAKYSVIHYGTPRVTEYIEEPTKSIWNLFAIDGTTSRYKIVVPEGTIKNDYNLDAK